MKQLSTLLLIICLSFRVFGQQATMPKVCTNPPAGILVGGDFAVFPEFACLDFTYGKATIFASNPLSPTGERLTNLGYIFNFKDGDSLNFKTPTSTTVSKPGIYWIMQGGNERGQTYITCKAVEIIQTEVPDVDVSISCDKKTVSVNFLNTAKNQKHGKYQIVWEDGIQEFVTTNGVFPILKTHDYKTPLMIYPSIVGIYTRGGIDVCRSEPYDFSFEPVYKPIVNKVQNLNDGKRAKISMEGGNDDKVYAIQQKISDRWTNTGYRISRKKGETSSEIEFEITQPSSEDCFRLQAVDSLCNNGITSNEICKLSLEASYLSNKQVKLSWNALDTTNLMRYIISYSEFDGSNSNTSGSQNRANSFNFEIPDCSKKYNIEVIGEYINLPNKMISVSQKIVIDPSCNPILSTSKEADSFNIYPNPSEDFVQLNSSFQLKTVEIVDLQGKVIENQNIENGQVSVKHLPKGKYILRLYGNDKKLVSSKAIIKM